MKSVIQSKNYGLLTTGFIFIFVIAYIFTGYITLDEESRRMPIMTGYVTLFLLAMDLIIGLQSRGGSIEPEHDMINITFVREIQAILYVVVLGTGVYLAGFFIALPVYLIASIYLQGHQSFKLAVLVALPASIAIYVIFELLLELELFTGILFS